MCLLSLKINKTQNLIGTPLRKKPLRRPKYRWKIRKKPLEITRYGWEDNIKINKELRYKDVFQIWSSGSPFEHNNE
jgi:hypothetical protein